MQLSAANCRTERDRQLEWSLNDPLPNRRMIAARAAEAWAMEALRAEEREAKPSGALSKEDAEIAREFAEEEEAERKPR